MKLLDMIQALQERGRYEEALIYRTLISAQLYLKQGLSEKRVLNMTVDEIEVQMRLPEKPLKYEAWDGFWWGEAAYR